MGRIGRIKKPAARSRAYELRPVMCECGQGYKTVRGKGCADCNRKDDQKGRARSGQGQAMAEHRVALSNWQRKG